MAQSIEVLIIESERGWGQKIDEVKFFDTLEEANKFITEYNSKNNLNVVPDWYMYARLSMDHNMNEQYKFFWNGPFSQWYSSVFEVDGIKFSCAEQYMMYNKAILFNDMDTANKIMLTTNPKTQKQLGRQVKGFDPEVWSMIAKDVVYKGNYAKFTQNKSLHSVLMSTGSKILVEASPYDAIWGIGLNEDVAKKTPADKWPGTNWLGEVLTKVRDDLLKEI